MNYKVTFTCFNLEDVHVVGCNPCELDAMRYVNTGQPWDFSHAGTSIISILGENPGHDIYLNGYAVSYLPASPHQAPVYSGFLMPSELGQPTNSMCLVDNQRSTEELISFDQLGCFWKRSDDPNHKGRVHFLACNRDLGSVSENDAYRYEYAVIFMASPGDLSTKRHGKCIVDQVDFSFPLLDEEVVRSTWLPGQQKLDKHINRIVKVRLNQLPESLQL